MALDAKNTFDERIREARNGSIAALGELLEHFRPMLMTIARAELDPALQPKGGPSDIVQQSFIKAQQSFPCFTGDTANDLKRWLQTILRNTLTDFVREYRSTAKRDLSRESHSIASGIQWTGGSPSHLASQDEQATKLQRAISALSDEQREAIRLRHEEGRSFAEIGLSLGKSEEAARKIWGRAVEALRQKLKSDESDLR